MFIEITELIFNRVGYYDGYTNYIKRNISVNINHIRIITTGTLQYHEFKDVNSCIYLHNQDKPILCKETYEELKELIKTVAVKNI